MRPSNRLLAALPLILHALPAAAADGVLQINQACAVQTGCFTGDAAGYPVQITTPGSYVLTGNLVLPDANTSGILVGTPGVHIDLNGFQIVRSGCETAQTSCVAASGTGNGIDANYGPLRGISVANGGITGMGSDGVVLGDQARVANLEVRWNRRRGIAVGHESSVSRSSALGNGEVGILTGNSAIVSENVSTQNGGHGIETSPSSTVSGNSASYNAADGIHASDGSTVSGNTATGNASDGIEAGGGVLVSGNVARSNGVYGLNLTGISAYRENVLTFNTSGGVSGGVNRGDNYCYGAGVTSDLCP